MTAREALRTQLDAVTTERNALEAENRKLKEDHPEQAVVLRAEQELTQTRQENARLAKELAEIKGLYEQLLRGTTEAEAEASASETEAAERRTALEAQVNQLKSELEAEKEKKLEQQCSVQSLRQELDSEREHAEEAERRCVQLEREAVDREREAELSQLRAVMAEKRQWESREARLVQRLQELESQLSETAGQPARVPDGVDEVQTTTSLSPSAPSFVPSSQRAEARQVQPQLVEPGDTPGAGQSSPIRPVYSQQLESQPCQSDSLLQQRQPDTLPLAMMAQQLPPLPKFTGDGQAGSDEEHFPEWLERLEMVANMCGWSEQAKLVNLVTRLRGSAYSFYRSCTPVQRSHYTTLTTALTKRFTPVSLQSVQSSRFHERKQRPSETVDDYAQELRKLFYGAYPLAQQGSAEAEAMGRSVLACQFVSGLRTDIKTKIAGMEGEFEHLLTKARFEEAKLRELSDRPTPSKKPPGTMTSGNPRGPDSQHPTKSTTQTSPRCFNCGMTGHISRNCPRRTRALGSKEARGQPKPSPSQTAAITVAGEAEIQAKQERVAELRRQLQEAEVDEVLETVSATLHGLTPQEGQEKARLGPTVTAEVLFEGSPVKALIDTGSPVTIVSLDFALRALAKNRSPNQTREEWRRSAQARLESPTVSLLAYGGGKLNVVCQMEAHLTRGECSVQSVVQCQRGAPVDLLIGTDLQPQLGFLYLDVSQKQNALDLLGGKSWTVSESGSGQSPQELEQPVTSTHSMENDPVETRCLNEESMVQTHSPRERLLETHSSAEQATVRLVTATRLPPCHGKLVKAQVGSATESSLSLFVSAEQALKDQGLLVEDGVTEPNEEGIFTLAVQNYTMEPVCLEKDQVLGQLQPATLVTAESLHVTSEEAASPVETQVHNVAAETGESGEPLIPTVVEEDFTGLTEDEVRPLTSLLTRFSHLFSRNDFDLGYTHVITHSIDTGDHRPVRQPPRRIPFALRGKVEEMVQKMIQQGVIQPSQSPWASPIVLVAKRDGGTRFCIDYRKLNSVTKMDVFPLPRIDDSLDLLAGSRYFTTLDLASGYWQVALDKQSQEKTAFITHSGLYQFKVMPFGLCNGPATFQRLMEVVLADLIRDRCIAYLDDILVLGRTLEEHLWNLEQVFVRLEEAGLKLKPAKCHFLKRSVKYLGHVISAQGISPDPDKVQAVQTFPVPTNLKKLRSFLGLSSYYRRFIPQFSSVANPLFALTRKDVPFEWTKACSDAFGRLQQLLTQAPLLGFPDFSREFILETDASGDGLGAVLAQKLSDGAVHPLAYASRSLQPHEKNYGVTELEGLGVVWAAKHFRPYLYGHHTKVYTDHEALKSLLNTPHPSGKLARWGMALQELDLEILFRPGKRNANADALSRSPTERSSTPTPGEVVAAIVRDDVSAKDGEDTLSERQKGDIQLGGLIQYLTSRQLPSDEKEARTILLSESQYTMIDGVLFHVEPDKSLRVVPPTRERKQLWNNAHSGDYGGHLRDAKVHSQLSRHYWWPSMRKDIIQWNRGCLTCATRRVGKPVKPPLTPIPVKGPFDRVGVDVIQFVKSYNGNRYAVVFVDYLTKWPEVFATSDQTALTIAQLIMEHIVPRHGVPSHLLSDRGPAFLSGLIHEVCELLGMHKVNTTAYHPQTDGLVERFNRTLTDMLAKTVDETGRDWDTRLPYVLFAYRSSMQESTQESPFYLLYGRDPTLPTEAAMTLEPDREQVDVDSYKAELTRGLSDAWRLAQSHVLKAQKRQKKVFDRSAKSPCFTVGDRVFLYVPSVKSTKAHKFAKPFRGPYRITQLYENGADIVLIARPKASSIRVALNRLRYCPVELCEELSLPGTPHPVQEPGTSGDVLEKTASPIPDPSDPGPRHTTFDQSLVTDQSSRATSIWTGRLRSRKKPVEDNSDKDGDM